MSDKCPECGATLKLLLTSWFCPDENDHDEKTNPERPGFAVNSPWIKIPSPTTVTIAPDMQTAVTWWGNPTHFGGPPGKCPHAKQYRDADSNIWCYDCGADPN